MAGTEARYSNSVAPGESYQYGASFVGGFGSLPERSQGLGQSGVLTGFSGVLLLNYTRAPKSMPLSNMSYVTSASGVAAATPTLIRYAVYTLDASGNLTLAASSANDTSLFAVSSTRYTKAVSGSLQIVKGQWYAVGLLMVSGVALPNLLASVTPTTNFNVYNLAPRIAGQLAGQSDLPASISAGSVASINVLLWAELT